MTKLNEKFLRRARGGYPFEVITETIVIRPEKLENYMRGWTAYVPFRDKRQYHYLFELETDAEYFKRKYVSNF